MQIEWYFGQVGLGFGHDPGLQEARCTRGSEMVLRANSHFNGGVWLVCKETQISDRKKSLPVLNTVSMTYGHICTAYLDICGKYAIFAFKRFLV